MEIGRFLAIWQKISVRINGVSVRIKSVRTETKKGKTRINGYFWLLRAHKTLTETPQLGPKKRLFPVSVV